LARELESQISVVIVNRNTKELLRNCLDSLPAGFLDIAYEVWVVDNGSADGSADMVAEEYADIHLIRNDDNLGFAWANNQALERVKTPLALLLNSDTVLTRGSMVHLDNFLSDHSEAAIVGPKLIAEDGSLQFSTYPLPRLWKDIVIALKLYKVLPKRIKSRLLLGSFWDHNEARAVGRITGACILVRMTDLRAANFLDKNFFFYGEVHDLCWTLWQKNRQTWFNPASVVIHLGGQSSKKMWSYKEQRRRMWKENEKLLRKHQRLSAVRAGILLKWLGLVVARIKDAIYAPSANSANNIDLLEVDLDWHSGRIKEWLWFKCQRFVNVYFEKSSYSIRFQKKLTGQLTFPYLSDGDFKAETDRIQTELKDKWNEAQDSWNRTGIMDFSSSTLIFHLVRWLKPRIVVETGVANGASSTLILSAMEANGVGKLYSIDWSESEALSFVPSGKEIGWMVPGDLRKRWHLQIGRSEERLEPLLKQIETVDIFLHDSDHSYQTMMYEYKAAWPYLSKNGLLLSDDAKMNTAFAEFSKDTGSPAMVYKGILGICQKVK